MSSKGLPRTLSINKRQACFRAGLTAGLLLILGGCGSANDDATLSTNSTGPVDETTQAEVPTIGAALASAPIYRINAGGELITAADGDWLANTGNGPADFVNSGRVFVNAVDINTSGNSVPTGTPKALFDSERWDDGAPPEMIWTLPVTPGNYEVRLYFAETWAPAFQTGVRVFDVVIEGNTVLDDYDIFADVGANTAVMKSFQLTADSSIEIDFTHESQNPTVKAIEVFAIDGDQPVITNPVIVSNPLPTTTGDTVFRVNTGGPELNDTQFTWLSDNPRSAYVNTGNAATYPSDVDTASDMSEAPASLYRTERWDPISGPEMSWNIPVTPGYYEVRLYFAETWAPAFSIGKRIFDVSIENNLLLDNYDIFADVGSNSAVMKSFVVPSDEMLNIDFEHVIQNPTIRGLEVLKVNNSATPTVDRIKQMQSFGLDPDDVLGSGQIDWRNAWAAHDTQNLWLALENYEPIVSRTWGLGIFIDTDQDKTTGFRGFNNEYPTGVDYMIEGVEHYVYTGSGIDWSWAPVVQDNTSQQDAVGLIRVPLQRIGSPQAIDVFFRGNNESLGGDTIDYYPDLVEDATAATGARFFTYSLAAVAPPSPPTVTPPTGLSSTAKIDVRNNVEGPEVWHVSANSYTNTITVINTGEVPLSNITVSNDALDNCSFSYASLEVGETKSDTCTAPSDVAVDTTVFTHTATASANDPNGQIISDTDSSSFEVLERAYPKQQIVVTNSVYGASDGDDVTFIVEAANLGNEGAEINGIYVNRIPECDRQFDAPLLPGQFERYTCVATDVQIPLSGIFRIVGQNYISGTSINIREEGIATIDVSYGREGFDRYSVYNSVTTRSDTILVKNTGTVDLKDVQIITDNPSCDKAYDVMTPGASLSYECEFQPIRGDFNERTAVVSSRAPSGELITDDDSIDLIYRSDKLVDIQLGTPQRTYFGQPGETVEVTMTIANRGYLPSVIKTITVSSTDIDVSSCDTVASSIAASGLLLNPGQIETYDCSIILPAVLGYESVHSTLTYAVGNGQGPVTSTTYEFLGLFNVAEDVPLEIPTDTAVISYTRAVTDSTAMANPSIDLSRDGELISNGDFELVDNNNIPVGWLPACAGNAKSTELYGKKSVLVPRESCVSYVFDGNALAQLAGNAFKFSCEVRETNGGFTSITSSLNAVPTEVQTAYKTIVLEVNGDAPQNLTEGFVSLYAQYGAVFDNCSFRVIRASGGASISVTNQLEGPEIYGSPGPFEFAIEVTNTGDEDLSDIEISSDKLDCDTNFQSLAIDQSKTVVCQSTQLVNQDGQYMNHSVLATGLTTNGTIVSDVDSALYKNTIQAPNAYVEVTSNSQNISDLGPVAPGTDVVLDVRVANNGQYPLQMITSVIPSCSRVIEPSLPRGGIVSYQCVVENIQQDTVVDFEPHNRSFNRTTEHKIFVEQQ